MIVPSDVPWCSLGFSALFHDLSMIFLKTCPSDGKIMDKIPSKMFHDVCKFHWFSREFPRFSRVFSTFFSPVSWDLVPWPGHVGGAAGLGERAAGGTMAARTALGMRYLWKFPMYLYIYLYIYTYSYISVCIYIYIYINIHIFSPYLFIYIYIYTSFYYLSIHRVYMN